MPASANFSFEPRVQMSDANAGGVCQVFGVHQRFAAKTGKHEAHQLRARRFDGQTRGKAGGRGQVIDSASFSIV